MWEVWTEIPRSDLEDQRKKITKREKGKRYLGNIDKENVYTSKGRKTFHS